MSVAILTLSKSDVVAVDRLMKANSRTLGFLPLQALEEFATAGTVLGARDGNGLLMGYLLFARYPSRYRIVHLCVSEHCRGLGIARQLVDELKRTATTQCSIRLNCRRDFPANSLWPTLGFAPVDEKPARSGNGKTLVLWECRLGEDRQLDLFREKTSSDAMDAVIDAHVMFHLGGGEFEQTESSRSLLADYLVDLVDLCITDETYTEINRQQDERQREASRQLAHRFRTVVHDHVLASKYENALSKLLPGHRPSDLSDLRQIAKAASSDADVFVTEDDRLVRNATGIEELVGIRVVTPVTLAMEFHQRLNTVDYDMQPISGHDFTTRRLSSADLNDTLDLFRRNGERKSVFRQKIQSFLARPQDYECSLVTIQNKHIGLVVRSTGKDRILTVHLVRTTSSTANRYPVREFLIADSLTACVTSRLTGVRFEPEDSDHLLKGRLLEAGFLEAEGRYHRPCIVGVIDRGDLLNRVRKVTPKMAMDHYAALSETELAKSCAPVRLVDHEETDVIVPIRPGYAMSLFDRQAARDDMFGGRQDALMRWANVYYRKKTHQHVLTAPARMFWYESGQVGAITAVSWLEEVELDNPKSLFRRYRRFGTLDWKDLYGMCDGDPERHLMALRFSQTFSFLRPITLSALRTMEGRQNVPLQSPWLISVDLANRIYRAGFPDG